MVGYLVLLTQHGSEWHSADGASLQGGRTGHALLRWQAEWPWAAIP